MVSRGAFDVRFEFIDMSCEAKIPTIGRLVSLNRKEFAIEVAASAGTIRVHFPRLEFSLKLEAARSTASKL
jgi:hypothetical protein